MAGPGFAEFVCMQKQTMRKLFLASLCLGLWSSPAFADRDSHFDMSFSFLAGQRSYDGATFGYAEGTASPSLGGSFSSPPFSGVAVAGPGGEANLVVDRVRFTIGLHRPYASLATEQRSLQLSGGPQVQVHKLDVFEVRYGLGYEVPLDRFMLHADLMGTTDSLSTLLTVGDDQATYKSKNFSYSARIGGRYAINDHYYAHASAEIGLIGNIDASGYIGVGFRAP